MILSPGIERIALRSVLREKMWKLSSVNPMAGWSARRTTSQEAGLKYFLIGVLSSAVMLYGMSIVYGITSKTLLVDISSYISNHSIPPLFAVAVFLTLVGFAFKVSAVPFHFWAPDTYEGAPTPVTAFLSVASKAGGFVALLSIIKFGFFPSGDSWEIVLGILAAASMTIGNLAALRQTNIVRMLAYSSIAQGGFILVPLAVAGDVHGNSAWQAVVIYLLIYGAMNLGAFAAVAVDLQDPLRAQQPSSTQARPLPSSSV